MPSNASATAWRRWPWCVRSSRNRCRSRITRNRIYVLPTGFGLFLAAMLTTMLVGGLNYNNNPALLLVFLLAGVAHNSLVHAHLILSGMQPEGGPRRSGVRRPDACA